MLDRLLKPRSIKGPGGGMDDLVPATIVDDQGNAEPALLSSGEYVITADLVSLLGDGDNERGAEILDAFCEEIRMLKTGTKKQPKQLKSLLSKVVQSA